MTIVFGIMGVIVAYLIIAIPQSLYTVGAKRIQGIMLFGKFHTFIENVEGKILKKNSYGGCNFTNLLPHEKKRINLYFFLWPFYKVYNYKITYTKNIKSGQEQPGDIILWEDKDSKELIVSRTGFSNFLEYRVEYPIVTNKLETEELAKVNVFTNNILEIEDPWLAFFGISNWFQASNEILNGALRGLVAERSLHDLNKISSEGGVSGIFNEKMKDLVNMKDDYILDLEILG